MEYLLDHNIFENLSSKTVIFAKMGQKNVVGSALMKYENVYVHVILIMWLELTWLVRQVHDVR